MVPVINNKRTDAHLPPMAGILIGGAISMVFWAALVVALVI